jgi:hypothetical protein
MSQSEQLEKLGLEYDDCFPTSICIIKKLLIKDDKWGLLEKSLKIFFKDLYEYRLMDKRLLDIQVYCDSPTDTEYLNINMVFENPDGEPRNDPWKNQPAQ